MSFITSNFESVKMLCAYRFVLTAYAKAISTKRGADRRKNGARPVPLLPAVVPGATAPGQCAQSLRLALGASAWRFGSAFLFRGSRGSLRSARLDGGLPLLGARAPTPYVVGRPPCAPRPGTRLLRASSARPVAVCRRSCCRSSRPERATLGGGFPGASFDCFSCRSGPGPAGLRPPGRHRRLGAPRSHDGLRPVGSCLPGSPGPSCPCARPRRGPLGLARRSLTALGYSAWPAAYRSP